MILARPYTGVFVWSWLAYMNPHKLSWGFAYYFPFAQIVAITTLVAIATNPNVTKKIPWTRESILLLIFTSWMFFTTINAFNSSEAWQQWDKVWKIQLFTFVTMMLINDREKIEGLLWVIVFSIGFYAVKGGIFTIMTGGSYSVYGPGGTFIGDNNAIGLAMIMTLPWMRYFQLVAPPGKKLIKVLLTIAMTLTIIAIIGTRSRGAFVGVIVMLSVLFSKNLKNIGFVIFIGLVFYSVMQFMPADWQARMGTITTDTESIDSSAQGRLDAWEFAYNIAAANPLTGGGFECFRRWLFNIYAPGNMVHDAHSIYFEILGEHGFIGLGMFLILGLFCLLSARTMIKDAERIEGLEWMKHLASMMQVSLIGYAATGTFLGLAYFDLYYMLVAILVVTKKLLDQELTSYNRSQISNTKKASFAIKS